MKAPTAQRPAVNRLEQKNQIPPHRILDALESAGVTVSERVDAPGTLRCKMLPEAEGYYLPIIRHYKPELLRELKGEPAYTEGTYTRFMSLSLVKCHNCQNYIAGQQYKGRYKPGRCEVRAMDIARPAKGIRCLWYQAEHH